MRKQKNLSLIFSIVFVFLLTISQAYADGYSITAQVDKNEVGFGESFNLVVTIVQELKPGMSNQLTIPQINSIPNFDIAGTRSSQQQSWVNSTGQVQVQTLLELVPQKPGDFNIPAFKVKGPDGKDYQTDAIAIKVLPPTEEPESEAESAPAATENKHNSNFNYLLIAGLILGIIVIIPLILAAFMGSRQKTQSKMQDGVNLEASGLTPKTAKNVRNEVEDAVIANEGEQVYVEKPVIKAVRKINFDDEVNQLKKRNPEVNKEFYQEYFGLFKLSLIGQCSCLTEDMTPDEILKKSEELCRSEDAKEAISRIAKDQELVLFANMVPERSFNSIHTDTKNILISIS